MIRRWIGMHIFYAASLEPLLLEGVAPVVAELRSRGLIKHYFFLRYWLEGAHVRLRLLPAEGVTSDELKAVAERVIGEFLQRRPALYRYYDGEGYNAMYKSLYIDEYGEAQWWANYPDDRMPLRPNNSYDYIAYEPEYARYGGPAGVALAEWHFEQSSDIVLRLLEETNVHVRPILLGQSIRLTLPFLYGFLERDEVIEPFLHGYYQFWKSSFQRSRTNLAPIDKSFDRVAEGLQRRIEDTRSHVVGGQPLALLELDRAWLAHIRELRARLEALIDERQLIFPTPTGELAPVDDPRAALNRLMMSYIHMTNNRLGVGTGEESYLAYLMQRALSTQAAAVEEAA